MPDPVTVSNSSCLIGLELIGRLDLIHGLYGTAVAKTGFRIFDALIQDTLRRAGE